jgi:hypothetical protein
MLLPQSKNKNVNNMCIVGNSVRMINEQGCVESLLQPIVLIFGHCPSTADLEWFINVQLILVTVQVRLTWYGQWWASYLHKVTELLYFRYY